MSKMVRDAMTAQPVAIEPSASVKSAAELMRGKTSARSRWSTNAVRSSAW